MTRPIFGVHDSQGSAETLVRGGGITNYHLIAYSFSNISAKNHQIRLMCIEVIVCNVTVVFLRHSVVSMWGHKSGGPWSFYLATEGSVDIFPVCVVSRSSTDELVTGASLSHPDAVGLKGATLRAPIASACQLSGSVHVAPQPDVETEFCQDVGPPSGFEMGL